MKTHIESPTNYKTALCGYSGLGIIYSFDPRHATCQNCMSKYKGANTVNNLSDQDYDK